MSTTLTSRRIVGRLAGRTLEMLATWQRPMSVTAMQRHLDCNRGTLSRAIEHLVGIGAVAVHPQSKLVMLLDREVKIEVPPEPLPATGAQALPEMDERLVHAAILRRAEACVRSGNLPGAVNLLNKAAERCRPEVAINFLALGDLFGAGHRAYPTITRAEAWTLQAAAGVDD
ncbi:hypothetical protein [Bosea sp. ASV33]|uniref:hypothetical protein n=1 Tax=Bosea sp. ASV33 TaxID=2795106 RepID=UPI0018EB21CA|nr:hypothetical protein [Bosea sp. ASV33]